MLMPIDGPTLVESVNLLKAEVSAARDEAEGACRSQEAAERQAADATREAAALRAEKARLSALLSLRGAQIAGEAAADPAATATAEAAADPQTAAELQLAAQAAAFAAERHAMQSGLTNTLEEIQTAHAAERREWEQYTAYLRASAALPLGHAAPTADGGARIS